MIDTHLSPNKQTLLNFLDLLFGQNKPAEAFARYTKKPYRQHNPLLSDDPEAAIAFFTGLNKISPPAQYDVRHMVEEGDRVVAFSYQRVGGPDGPIVCVLADMFRFEDGKIVEHWDVIQRYVDLPFSDREWL